MLTGKRPISALLTLFLVFLALCAAPGSAGAHALLVDSQPKNGAVLQSAPREIVLRFDARIEASLSSVKLLRSDGHSFPVSIAAAGGEKEPDRLAVTLPGLAPGNYSLQYNVLATDGHLTPGVLRFSIVQGR